MPCKTRTARGRRIAKAKVRKLQKENNVQTHDIVKVSETCIQQKRNEIDFQTKYPERGITMKNLNGLA